jgi:prophage antirepressor-like protein
MINGEPWWVAKDVCDVMGLQQVSRAISRLDEDEGGLLEVPHPQNPNKLIQVNGVNEAGLYQLILRSKKPEAKTFRRWVTHEVLPAIRKTGSYVLPQASTPMYHIPANYIEAMEYAIALAKANNHLQTQVDEMAPKAITFDLLIAAKNDVTVNEFVKAFGHGWGRNKLFAWLRAKSLLMANNLPYQRYVDTGYFTVRVVPKQHGEKGVFEHSQCMITPKGMDWLSKLLLSEVNERTLVLVK